MVVWVEMPRPPIAAYRTQAKCLPPLPARRTPPLPSPLARSHLVQHKALEDSDEVGPLLQPRRLQGVGELLRGQDGGAGRPGCRKAHRTGAKGTGSAAHTCRERVSAGAGYTGATPTAAYAPLPCARRASRQPSRLAACSAMQVAAVAREPAKASATIPQFVHACTHTRMRANPQQRNMPISLPPPAGGGRRLVRK